MINISKLYCDQITPGDWLRYGIADSKSKNDQPIPANASERKPIVIWNITARCNLKCVHCYNNSGTVQNNELTTAEAKAVLEDLAGFGVPCVLLSGGEPLMRGDLFELLEHAANRGLRTVLSTNGTLITAETAAHIKAAGVSYVGVSLDGIGPVNDRFRGVDGAFDAAVGGIRHCRDAGVRVGLRLTLTRRNVQELERLFEFFETEGIERACFYHLVPSGRGKDLFADRLTAAESRAAMEMILAKTKALQQAGKATDILTVDNHADGVYLYLKLLAQNPSRAADVRRLLAWNGGGLASSGMGIGCIDFGGKVHADQFWGHVDIGDVREKPFSAIWGDDQQPLLKGLRNRRAMIKGRCRLCRFFDLCGGSLRVRADLTYNDPWAPDPACYLSDAEIGLDDEKRRELARTGEVFDMPG